MHEQQQQQRQLPFTGKTSFGCLWPFIVAGVSSRSWSWSLSRSLWLLLVSALCKINISSYRQPLWQRDGKVLRRQGIARQATANQHHRHHLLCARWLLSLHVYCGCCTAEKETKSNLSRFTYRFHNHCLDSSSS